jgi:hypothetical protein
LTLARATETMRDRVPGAVAPRRRRRPAGFRSSTRSLRRRVCAIIARRGGACVVVGRFASVSVSCHGCGRYGRGRRGVPSECVPEARAVSARLPLIDQRCGLEGNIASNRESVAHSSVGESARCGTLSLRRTAREMQSVVGAIAELQIEGGARASSRQRRVTDLQPGASLRQTVSTEASRGSGGPFSIRFSSAARPARATACQPAHQTRPVAYEEERVPVAV